MITSAHVLVGGATAVAITAVTPNLVLATGAAIVTHFLLDMVPHYDVPPSSVGEDGKLIAYTPRIIIQVSVDTIVAVGLVLALWYSRHGAPDVVAPFMLGALGGFVPDLIDNVPFWNRPFRNTRFGAAFHRLHEATHMLWIHRFPMTRFAWLGVLTQIITILLALKYLL